jgi:uncharacterized protein YjaG (DUF416 family)
MNYRDYIALLKIQTNSQPYKQQLEFAVMICKKLYFEYKNFVEIYQWGDADLLMDAINICDRSKIANSSDLDQIKELIPKIDLITPHMDDFGGSEIGSYALNASASVYETLEFIIDQDKTHIFNIATYYTDTIDFKIQEERDLTELEIENHPVMIEAWSFIIEQTKHGA